MDSDKNAKSNLPSFEIASAELRLYQKVIERINRFRQIYLLILAASITFLCFLWTYRNVKIVYAINDDIQFQEMANGSFSGLPDGHLIYIKYVLGWVISHLYILDKHFDWYGLTMLGLLYICLLLILFRALEMTGTFKQKIMVIALVLVGYVLFGLQQASELQYTIVAGLLAATAIFWLYTSDSKTRYRRFVDPVICVLLMLASYMVRSNVFFMSLPFAGIVFLYRNLDWRNRRIRQWMLPVSVLIGMGAVLLIEQAAYRDPDWKAYLEFNRLRTRIYDYCGLPTFSKNQEFYRSIGVSGETFDLLATYTFIANPSANNQTFQAIVEKCMEIKRTNVASTPLSSRVNKIMHELFTTMLDGKYALIGNTCLALFISLIARRRANFSYIEAFFVLALLSIPFVEGLYLVIEGRFIDRVVWVLYLIEVLLLIAIALRDNAPFLLAGKGAYPLIVVLLSIVLLVEVVNYKTQAVKNEVQGWVGLNEKCQKVRKYIADHPENYYFISTYSFVDCTKTFRIRANDHFNNFSSMGGWEFFSPPLIENFRKHGINDTRQDLVGRNNILVLIKPPDSMEYIVKYYRSINLNVVPDVVDTIDLGDGSEGVTVLKLEVVQDSIQ